MKVFAFFMWPILELYLLIKVGAVVGALKLVLWVFVSAFIGLWVTRAQGMDVMQRAREDMAAGRAPQHALMEGLLLFAAGLLLILPGLISDAVGLLLLVPPLRHLAGQGLARYFASRQGGMQSKSSRIIFFDYSRSGSSKSGDYAPGQGPFPPDSSPFSTGRDETPRQATIIESTAIDVTPGEKKKDDPSGTDSL